MLKQILLNFDLEEFDIPEEYGQKIDSETKIRVTSEGLIKILNLLEKLNLTATFFTTVYFAQNQLSLLRKVIVRHEIASHGVSHSEFKQGDLLKSRLELEKLGGKRVCGFRQPRFESVNKNEILLAGYSYDSSENPIWLPGRYMRLFKPRLPYFSKDLEVSDFQSDTSSQKGILKGEKDFPPSAYVALPVRRGGTAKRHAGGNLVSPHEHLLNLPISTSPVIRYPLFWLSFKNSPLWLFKIMSLWTLKQDGYLNIVFHPWEFTDLSSWQLPVFVKRLSGEKMLEKLRTYLVWLKNKAEFVTCSDFSEHIKRAVASGNKFTHSPIITNLYAASCGEFNP